MLASYFQSKTTDSAFPGEISNKESEMGRLFIIPDFFVFLGIL